tara:strand:- start:1154 stop:1507 length:354 start_codon:yes stop_codon:yes gene_type:complete
MSFADKSPVAIAKLMSEIGGDGHSILPPEWINAHADPALHDLIEPLFEDHSSNFSHPKLTIFKEGYPIDAMHGVRALDLQFQIAADLDCSEALMNAVNVGGRSNQARILSKGILEKL